MVRKIFLLLFALVFAVAGFYLFIGLTTKEMTATNQRDVNGTKVLYLNAEDSWTYLQDTAFANNLGTMDISIRQTRDASNMTDNGVAGSYLDFFKANLVNWPNRDADRIHKHAAQAIEKLQRELPGFLPAEMRMVRTTGDEEFGAFYTLKKSIIFPAWSTSFQVVTFGGGLIDDILYHELFHIFTRNNPETAKQIYEVLGFTPMDFTIPQDLKKRIITNPDVTSIHYAVRLQREGKAGLYTILTYNKYDQWQSNLSAMDQLGFGLFPLIDDEDGGKTIGRVDSQYKAIPDSEFDDLAAITGAFTKYRLGPEEMAADGFAMVMTTPASELETALSLEDKAKLDAIFDILQQ